MKSFNRVFALVIALIIMVFLLANILIPIAFKSSGRPYRVEISRLADEIEKNGFDNINLDNCVYVTNITCFDGKNYSAFFEDNESDYSVRVINGETYRFDYTYVSGAYDKNMVFSVNVMLAVMSIVIILILLFFRISIIRPFEDLRDVPYELSKGNLTVPIKENKYKFFGKFVWGVNVLRENMEKHRQLELSLLREKKMLVISLSHDIKTPLSAIKLYSKALSKGLYRDRQKQLEIAESINSKADEIEKYVSEIIQASSENFLELDVEVSEFYLSALTDEITRYYRDKLEVMKIDFNVGEYADCILKGDFNRSVEVLQNIIENAIKYGDGDSIELDFSEEEDCKLITVKNGGCTLREDEIIHIFESFIRGSNADGIRGNGLGLYICRKLMNKMGGEIYAEMKDGNMLVTTVFSMACT
ncbi:MAG: HAMP domain-containing histidine kinase [Lachnospiraceae bacterium]|nr:HAMP domain-containing histidine kinase [Lachnospiraceae bacterium]